MAGAEEVREWRRGVSNESEIVNAALINAMDFEKVEKEKKKKRGSIIRGHCITC